MIHLTENKLFITPWTSDIPRVVAAPSLDVVYAKLGRLGDIFVELGTVIGTDCVVYEVTLKGETESKTESRNAMRIFVTSSAKVCGYMPQSVAARSLDDARRSACRNCSDYKELPRVLDLNGKKCRVKLEYLRKAGSHPDFGHDLR